MHQGIMQSWTKKAEVSLDLIRGREVLADLLMEAEIEADLERMIRLTPEQLEEVVGQPAAAPVRSLANELDDLIDEAWIRRIAGMTLFEIRELAEGSSLTDEQAEAILRRAKKWIEELEGPEPTH
jgi:hypothetical protein